MKKKISSRIQVIGKNDMHVEKSRLSRVIWETIKKLW